MRYMVTVNRNGSLKGNDDLEETGEQPLRQGGGQDGKYCVEYRSTQKVLKELRIKQGPNQG
jgi:hypothetical protein